MANIMRIFFWFSSGYAFNLFIQSFLVIGIQFMLLDACVKIGYKKANDKASGFWRWDKLNNFGIFGLIQRFLVCSLQES